MDAITIRSGGRDYEIKPYEISVESLRRLYEKMSKFPVVFGKQLEGPEDFVNLFISYSIPSGDPSLNGIFWAIDDLEVGVFYLTNIFQHEAEAHFTFFDAQLRHRKWLIKTMASRVMGYFGFRRLNITLPKYANERVHDIVKECGAVYEGRKYGSAPYNGKWFDETRYAILSPHLITKEIQDKIDAQIREVHERRAQKGKIFHEKQRLLTVEA